MFLGSLLKIWKQLQYLVFTNNFMHFSIVCTMLTTQTLFLIHFPMFPSFGTLFCLIERRILFRYTSMMQPTDKLRR